MFQKDKCFHVGGCSLKSCSPGIHGLFALSRSCLNVAFTYLKVSRTWRCFWKANTISFAIPLNFLVLYLWLSQSNFADIHSFCLSYFSSLASEELWSQLCCLVAGVFVDRSSKSSCEQKVLPLKYSGGLALHEVLAYCFDPGILISCCHWIIFLFGSHLVLFNLFLFCFCFDSGLSIYAIFFSYWW